MSNDTIYTFSFSWYEKGDTGRPGEAEGLYYIDEVEFCASNEEEARNLFAEWQQEGKGTARVVSCRVVYNEADKMEYMGNYGTPEDYYRLLEQNYADKNFYCNENISGERRIVISDNASSEGRYGEQVFLYDNYEHPVEKLIRTAARMRPDKLILEGRSAGIEDPDKLLAHISFEIIKAYTLDDVYDRANDTAFGDPRLKAKDEALYQITDYIREQTGENPYDEADRTGASAEDIIFDYIDDNDLLVRFDERGNIVALHENNTVSLEPIDAAEEEFDI